jgi:hypothetical protein
LKAVPETDPIIARIRAVITVTEFHPAPLRPLFEPDGRRLRVPMTELIEDVERRLAVPMPSWLRTIYLCCNGFSGPYGVGTLYHLDGDEGVLDFTLFLRTQEWSPPWLKRAIVFGDTGAGGSITTHWAALDGQLIEWCYGDGAAFTVLEPDLFALWRRVQEGWDAVDRPGREHESGEPGAAADRPRE